MNKKTKRSPNVQNSQSLLLEAGPLLSECLRRIGPPEEARRHFNAARVEFLKGIRALLDARIEQVSKMKAKGEKISVE
jgi:hypothetical protein